MKIRVKVVLALTGTVLLTAVILFALDVPYAQQAAARLAAFAGAADTDELAQADKTGSKEAADKLSIGTDENQLVSQTQEDTALAGQAAEAGGQDGQTGSGQQAGSAGQQAAGTNKQAGSAGQQAAGCTDQQTDSANGQSAKDGGQNTFQTVTQDYFSDALFIGDSRTVGMQQSGLLPNAAYYAKIGIGIGDILTQRIVSEGGTMISVKEALSRHSFGKVYIMIGINDMSRGDADWFTEQYEEILHTVRQTQPDAVIYIQGNIPMSYHTQDFTGSLNNMNLEERNEASRQLADGKNIFYLGINDVYADVNGHLDTTYTTDGLHVSTKYYPRWVDYLMRHAIVR